MRTDDVLYIVTHEDEGRAPGMMAGAGSFIPSIGIATTAIDQYRTVGIYSNNLRDLGVAVTDVPSMAALSKIAEGDVRSAHDLQAAETALQALLLHDYLSVISWSPKVIYSNGLVTYGRSDFGVRTPLAFELAALAEGRDWLVAPEIVRESDGIIASSSLGESSLLGQQVAIVAGHKSGYDYDDRAVIEGVTASLFEHGLPSYLSSPALTAPRNGGGWEKRFYHKMRISWDAATQGLPAIVCAVNPPPLLAIVMHRMKRREDLLDVLRELRAELAPVRAELQQLNAVLTSARSQRDIEMLSKRWDESFASIVAESRLSDSERFRRRVGIVHQLGKAILRPMVALFTGRTGMTLSALQQHTGPIEELVKATDILADRTVTAATFSKLLQTEALQDSMKRIFYSSELASIDRSSSM